MLKIKLIVIGKLKESYLREAQAEYTKRLGAFCKFELLELGEERLPENPSPAQIENALKREAEKIKKAIPAGSYVYSMQIEGKQLTSEELAAALENNALSAKSTVVFLIGSSFGLDSTLKKQSDFALSFSKMTFPHQLARIMLLEQLYRAMSIQAGTKYHK